MAEYRDPIVQKYIDLIKAKNGAIITYYQGEPTRIANSLLPCCVVTKVKTEAQPESNVNDRHKVTMRITVITDMRQDLSTQESHAKLVEGISTLYDLMEGRKSDYTLKDGAILNVIRSNQSVAGNLFTDIDTATKIDYGLAKRAPTVITVEGRLEFTATVIQAA